MRALASQILDSCEEGGHVKIIFLFSVFCPFLSQYPHLFVLRIHIFKFGFCWCLDIFYFIEYRGYRKRMGKGERKNADIKDVPSIILQLFKQ